MPSVHSRSLMRAAGAVAAITLAVLTLSASRSEAAARNCFWMCTCLSGYGGHTDCCPKRVCTPASSSGTNAIGAAAQSRPLVKTPIPAPTMVAPKAGRVR